MRELAARQGVAIAGGDVVSAPVLAVTVSVTGWSGAADRLVYRSGARPGDVVGVTGELGGSGAGLRLLEGADPAGLDAGDRDALLRRHRRPEPLLATGLALAAAGVSAMIDVSDGLATDAGHVARASGVKLELRLADLPLAPGLAAVAERAARVRRQRGRRLRAALHRPARKARGGRAGGRGHRRARDLARRRPRRRRGRRTARPRWPARRAARL